MIYRPFIFRILTFFFTFSGLIAFITLYEAGYFIGYEPLAHAGLAGALLCFFLLTSSLVPKWSWPKYFIITGVLGALLLGGYLALWPEIYRPELRQASAGRPVCPLTVDRHFYRTQVLKDRPDQEAKIAELEDLCRAIQMSFQLSGRDTVRGDPCPKAPDLRLECFAETVRKQSAERPFGPLSQMAAGAMGVQLALDTQQQSGSTTQALLGMGKVTAVQVDLLRSWLGRSPQGR